MDNNMSKFENKKRLVQITLWIARFLFGLTFVASGFVKAIDPLGTAYKLQDYFLAFGMEWLMPMSLPMSITLNGLEFIIGMAVLLGLRMRYTAWGALLFMLFFTPLTLYIAVKNPVPDCGCFGDAIIISNWDTFYKNIVLLASAMFIFFKRKTIKPLLDKKRDWMLLGVIALAILWLSFYCLRNLPIIDFRPWKIGNNVQELMEEEKAAEFSITFLYENNETGEILTLSQDELMEKGVPDSNEWTFKSRKEVIIDAGKPPKIENFYIIDEDGNDYTDLFLTNPDYQFVIVAHNLFTADADAFKNRINKLAAKVEEKGYSFIVLAGNSFEKIDAFRHKYQTSYPFYQSDDIVLKTIVRSNPGLVLLKNGVIIDKWAHRNIPSFEYFEKKYFNKI